MFRDCLAFWDDEYNYPNDTSIRVYPEGVVLTWTSEDDDIGTETAFFANVHKKNYKELLKDVLETLQTVLANCYAHDECPEEWLRAIYDNCYTSALIAWERALFHWLK